METNLKYGPDADSSVETSSSVMIKKEQRCNIDTDIIQCGKEHVQYNVWTYIVSSVFLEPLENGKQVKLITRVFYFIDACSASVKPKFDTQFYFKTLPYIFKFTLVN